MLWQPSKCPHIFGLAGQPTIPLRLVQQLEFMMIIARPGNIMQRVQVAFFKSTTSLLIILGHLLVYLLFLDGIPVYSTHSGGVTMITVDLLTEAQVTLR